MTVPAATDIQGRGRAAGRHIVPAQAESEQCVTVPLETEAAKRIGLKSSACGHSDVVDVHVALLADEFAAAVVTSDRQDILTVSAGLKDAIVDVQNAIKPRTREPGVYVTPGQAGS